MPAAANAGANAGAASAEPRLGGAHASAASFGGMGVLNDLHDVSVGAAPSVAPPSGPGQGFGAGGLGLSGIGEGGGGRAAAFGPSGDSSAPSAPARRPQVSASSAAVSGRIAPEIVAHGVRRVFGRLRHCYERGLERDASLAGRVTVRFVIGRDGIVASAQDGGSTLPDPQVVACVVGCFPGIDLPEPEGGIVTVVYPILFAPGTTAPPEPAAARPSPAPGPAPSPVRSAPSWTRSWDGPSAVHRPGDDAWMKQGEDALAKLREAAAGEGASRQRHEALIRGLLARGRFPEALEAARRYADLDPDRARALELLAGAAAAAGDAGLARRTLDAETELAPGSLDLHARAARAFEAASDEPRACAHWRTIAALRPTADDALYQALRCRAPLGDPDAAAREAAAIERPGKLVEKLRAVLAGGAIPAYDAASSSPGEMEATVRCAEGTGRCPDVVVVKPSGDVVSPWAPAAARRSSAQGVAFSRPARRHLPHGAASAAPPARRARSRSARGRRRASSASSTGASQTVAADHAVQNPLLGPPPGDARSLARSPDFLKLFSDSSHTVSAIGPLVFV